MSSRPTRHSAAVRPHEKFAELKALRQAGKTRLSNYEVEEEEQLYEEVDEDDYRKMRRDKMLQDDFVVDDHGEGYIDNGEEDDWDRAGRRGYYSDEDGSEEEKKGASKMTCKSSRSISLDPSAQNLLLGHSKTETTA